MVYGSDPLAYDFEAELDKSLERARKARLKRQQAKRSAEDAYMDAFAENRFHPANRGGITYGLGYPTLYEESDLRLTPGEARTHQRKKAQQAHVLRAKPPTRRTATKRRAVGAKQNASAT